jgi:Transposase IS4
MSVHIFTIAQELWIPGRDLAVDEIMERFTGRSSDIVTIPSKPIPTGYKVWAVAQLGYILNVIYHRNGKGPIGSKAPKGSGINPTQAVVRYCVWLDNLFVSTTLLSYLRKLGYGAAGTARTNSGICQEFVAKKKAEQSNQYEGERF